MVADAHWVTVERIGSKYEEQTDARSTRWRHRPRPQATDSGEEEWREGPAPDADLGSRVAKVER